MKFVVDKNIPLVEKGFNSIGDVTTIETGEFTPDVVRDADVLVVRSETKVNKSLLDGSRVKFVGTATIGTDHIDLGYLKSKGITFASAPGCNSNSVKEYIMAALLHLSSIKSFSLKGKTIGVVGIGNVGSKVVRAAEALGMTVLQNDPPRARTEGNPIFLPLDELMLADIITLHVPLTKTGEDATYHFFDEKRFAKMKTGVIFINTSRGAVVETTALKKAIMNKRIVSTIIDVWENEPKIDTDLLQSVTIGTPHIAGYSLEGKTNAVRMIREAVCKHFNINSLWNLEDEIGAPDEINIFVPDAISSPEKILNFIVNRCYSIEDDNERLSGMRTLPYMFRGEYFKKLRTGYHIRREFTNFTVHLPHQHEPLKEIVRTLGFKCFIKEKKD
ncbi:MAG: 4-phosphoerythronate dehydrogenase [Bacteroidota bacterium]|nr:4-phosphoerythronate dehydrogenase [Bacteroidota bacterium]